ncbi:MAG: class I SAM-dependent methyltransferase [Patescibacteria group bacterium]
MTLKRYEAKTDTNSDWKHVFETALQGKSVISIDLALCLSCGFVFYRDVLDENELERLYAKENRYEKHEVSATKRGRIWELQNMSAFLERYTKNQAIKDILDIGAGDFVALEKISALVPQASIEAIDPSYASDSHKGIKVYRVMLQDFQPYKQYDLVMAIHVLEHVGDLKIFLEKLRGLSKKFAYIEIPFQVGPGLFLSRSVNAQHINYFTPKTITLLLEKYGFSVEALEFSSDAYRYNGMPGMIRIFAQVTKEQKGVRGNGLLSSLYFLLSPLILLRSKFF